MKLLTHARSSDHSSPAHFLWMVLLGPVGVGVWRGMEPSEGLSQIMTGASAGSGTEVLLLRTRGHAVPVLLVSGALL